VKEDPTCFCCRGASTNIVVYVGEEFPVCENCAAKAKLGKLVASIPSDSPVAAAAVDVEELLSFEKIEKAIEAEEDPWIIIRDIFFKRLVPRDRVRDCQRFRQLWLDKLAGLTDESLVKQIPALVAETQSLFKYRSREFEKEIADKRKGALDDLLRPAPLTEEEIEALRVEAAAVLDSPDPLEEIRQEIRRLGYGGKLAFPMILYVCWTSRLLPKSRGSMPCHNQTNGESGSGKTYGNDVVALMHPPEAYVKKVAASTRDLLHDEQTLRHRVLYYGQANSIPGADGMKPTEENSPVAAFFLSLLQDGEAAYSYPIKNPITGRFVSQERRREGPTVLVTTTVDRIAHREMDSRLFGLQWPDDREQLREALKAQADLHLGGPAPEPRPEFLSFQKYLQARAPFDVVFPFVHAFNDLIERLRKEIDPRILRDAARIRSLVCSIALLRHARRKIDDHGRIIAEIADYESACKLIDETGMYRNIGVPSRLRQIVEAVGVHPHVTQTMLSRLFKVSRPAISRQVRKALKEGWLINAEPRPGYAASLKVGEPLPEISGLPTSDQLVRWIPRTPYPPPPGK
jgi:hypothetical protein